MELLTGILLNIIGIVVGAVAGYLISRLQNKDKYSAQLFSEYTKMAQELAAILEELLTLSLRPRKYTTDYCNTIAKELSKYYFKYYLVLSQQVLEEISCLHACLQCGGKYFFMIDRTSQYTKIRPCKKAEEINILFADIALTQTRQYKEYPRIPNYITLKCQARHVITVMHNSWDYKDIHKWQKKLPKRTVFQLTNKK